MKKIGFVLGRMFEHEVDLAGVVRPDLLVRVSRKVLPLEDGGQTKVVQEDLQVIYTVPDRPWLIAKAAKV